MVAAVARRPTKWLGAAAVIAVLLLAGVSSASPRTTPTTLVWFGPLPGNWPVGAGDPDYAYGGSKDYMALFKPKAAWAKAASHVRIFKLYSDWMWIMTPSQLRRLVSDLKRRHIDLAVEVGPLVATEECGGGVEGFAGPNDAARVAAGITRAGGTFKYAALDEPFYYGALYDGPNACHWLAEKIAGEVAAYVKRLRRAFPKIVVGDIEPLAFGIPPEEIERWMDSYKRVTGLGLPFLHLDIGDSPTWAQAAHRLQNAARARGIPFGIIYSGDGETDEAWTATAEQRFVEYEAKEGLRPDHVIFQSWNDKPDYVLPETKRATFTWLIDRYLRPRPRLTLQVSPDAASGRLTRANSHPLSGRPIELTATPLDGLGVYSEYTLTGTVPKDAKIALVGYRVNTECSCSGAADFSLYESRYQEDGGANRVPNPRFDSGLDGWGVFGDGLARLEPSDRGGQALRVTAARGEVAGINGPGFPVTPGARFTVTFAARLAPSSAGSGYFTVMFLGPTLDTEVSRNILTFAAAPVSLGQAATNAQGAFSVPLAPLPPVQYLVEAWFRGDSSSFPAYAASRITR